MAAYPRKIQRSLALQACTRNAQALEQLGFVSSRDLREEEDDFFQLLRAENRSFIKRVYHH